MGRIRDIKPQFFIDDDVARLSFEARYLFIATFTIADRDGRFEDRPAMIKAQAMPYDDVDVDALLTEIEAGGFIVRYQVDGRRYIQIRTFSKHQKPHPKESAGNFPPPAVAESHKSKDDHSEPGKGWKEENLGVHAPRKDPTLSAGYGSGSGNGYGEGSEAHEVRPSLPNATTGLEFPCIGSPTAWSPDEEQLAEWEQLYPELDVRQECRQALAWVRARQAKRKTASGMPAFIVGWLNRSQNKRGSPEVEERAENSNGAIHSPAFEQYQERLKKQLQRRGEL